MSHSDRANDDGTVQVEESKAVEQFEAADMVEIGGKVFAVVSNGVNQEALWSAEKQTLVTEWVVEISIDGLAVKGKKHLHGVAGDMYQHTTETVHTVEPTKMWELENGGVGDSKMPVVTDAVETLQEQYARGKMGISVFQKKVEEALGNAPTR